MRRYGFEVVALSDLVFIESSNTEGHISYLDYIPGSVFLGIVAKRWSELEDPVGTLLGGKVRFGDAHLLIDDKPSVRVPFSFHHPKLKSDLVFNYHLIEKSDRDEYVQFSQMRSGYINEDLVKDEITLRFLQKSAMENGRPKKSAMFAYRSIPAETRFYFEMIADEEIGDEIARYLEGIHRIGKSKSAEYALAEITQVEPKKQISRGNPQGEHYLYVKSRLALIDERGNYTADLHHLHPKLTPQNIDYSRSQVRFGSYHPFVQKRGMHDWERFFVQKGSVVVLKDVDEEILREMEEHGVGAHKSEGFGEVLIDPHFLITKHVEFGGRVMDDGKGEQDERSQAQTTLTRYLKMKKERVDEDLKMITQIRTFLEEEGKWFTNISSSQWGRIRAYAKRKDDPYSAIKEYISTGIKQWREDQQRILLRFIEGKSKRLIELLAIEAAKRAKKEHA